MRLYKREKGARQKGKEVERQTMKREKECVCVFASVCLRTRGRERDGVRESASQKGGERERQREGN